MLSLLPGPGPGGGTQGLEVGPGAGSKVRVERELGKGFLSPVGLFVLSMSGVSCGGSRRQRSEWVDPVLGGGWSVTEPGLPSQEQLQRSERGPPPSPPAREHRRLVASTSVSLRRDPRRRGLLFSGSVGQGTVHRGAAWLAKVTQLGSGPFRLEAWPAGQQASPGAPCHLSSSHAH